MGKTDCLGSGNRNYQTSCPPSPVLCDSVPFILFQDQKESAIEDCSKALELNANYLKCLLRRAELYEKTEKLDEALTDYQKAVEMDPSQYAAREACMVSAMCCV